MQLGDGPGGVGSKVDKRVGQSERVGAGIGRGIGMHEHHGRAPLQLVEQRGELRGELRVPEVDAAGVTDEQDAI
jgi:hypothetical protein